MEDISSSPSLYDHIEYSTEISETNNDVFSKATTAKSVRKKDLIYNISFQNLPRVNPKKNLDRSKSYKSEPPTCDRGGWWRKTIKDTPNPGAYNTHLNTFVKEISARPNTYGFKSDGRRRDPQPLEPKGRELLPGAYSVEDFADRMQQLRLSYGFKGPEREKLLKDSFSGGHDKNIDVPPGLYNTQNYQQIHAPVESVKHSFFKSKTRRRIFLPRIGPAPSDYEPSINVITSHSPTITSSFKSGTNRFEKKLPNVPGPGTYDRLNELPSLKQLNTFSTRGVFFTANFAQAAATAV